MSAIRFIMVGGFLGAGKTTTLGRLARHYMDQGLRVGLVTNDQAQDLVDTHTLREQGFAVEEVAGACFCCKFDDLLDKVGNLEKNQQPDVVLAEPVGSCTDLVATVVQPIKDLFGAKFTVAPYLVIFKPSHGLKILRGDKTGGFSPKAEYIFRKQLEEADAILINRIDEIPAEQLEELVRLVTAQYPGVPVLRGSARTGHGFEAITQLLSQDGNFGRRILDIDYDVYAEGEAELGWLNSSCKVTASTPFDLDQLIVEIVQSLKEILSGTDAEVAHLKAIGLHDGSFGVANLVASEGIAELSLPSRVKTKEADVIVNARVALDPAVLQEHVERVVQESAKKRSAQVDVSKTQSFRPGRPTPTHRYAAGAAV